jgi:flagellar biosynthesis protein FlhF
LVTTDGYRIGAHEQLRIYGRILGVPVHLARDAKDLRATLHDLRHTHMVLIDTMGMSQRDRMVGEQVAMFRDSDVRSLLLLAATGRGDTLDDVVRAYSGLGLAGCVLTKVDEAASLASSLDVVIRHELRLYYISNGQRVPEDLHLPNRPYLLHRAFKDLPESSPYRLAGVEPGLMMGWRQRRHAVGRRTAWLIIAATRPPGCAASLGAHSCASSASPLVVPVLARALR